MTRNVEIHWVTKVTECHSTIVDLDDPTSLDEIGISTEERLAVRDMLLSEAEDDGTLTTYLAQIEGSDTESDATVDDRFITFRTLENDDALS